MTTSRVLIVFLACLVGLAVDSPPLAAQSTDNTTRAVLAAGDVVRITVWRRPELSGEFAVSAAGTLIHPLYRTVRVGGQPFSEVEARLIEFLQSLEANPQISVQPLLRVAVGGEVRTPNLYSLPPETTIAQAVALAGGMSERGRLDRVRLVRGGEAVLIDLTSPETNLAHITIRSGDQIFVARRVSIFREYIAPASSVVAALASLVRLATR
jgi:protein involved in polysaccharide export with SLBB domain